MCFPYIYNVLSSSEYAVFFNIVRPLRSCHGHLIIKDSHLFYYVPGSHINNKIDVANHGNVAGTLDDNFKMASNSSHNVHYVTPFTQLTFHM